MKKKAVNNLQAIYSVGDSTNHPFSRFISGTKGALVVNGIITSAFVNEPFSALDQNQLETIKNMISTVGG